MRVCSQRQSTTIPETEEIQSPPEQDTQPNSQHMDSSNHNHHELTFTSLAPPPYITSTCIHQQNSPPPPLTSSASTITSPTNSTSASSPTSSSSRYENQKRRDWNTFGQYLKNHKPPLTLSRCSGAHVLEFLRYLDQFGKTKVHAPPCPFYGHPNPPAPCPCPLRQAWGSLDALIGRLRAAFEENGGKPETNPFGARAVRLFLREVRDQQSKARGISYEKKKRKRPPQQPMAPMTQLNASGTVATTDNVDNIGTMYSFHRQPHHQVLDHRMVLMFPRGAATGYVYEGAT